MRRDAEAGGAPSSATSLAVTKTLPTDVVAFFGRNAPSDEYAGYHTCPASGCGVTSLASLGPSGAVSGVLPTCTGGVKTLASGLDSPTALRQWGDYLYWLVPSAPGALRGAVYRIAKP